MRGDKLVIQAHHRKAAEALASSLEPRLADRSSPLVVAIAGESGSGKSETAVALSDALVARGFFSLVIQQDDYFIHAPKTNDRRRREEIAWVGPGEVRLGRLDADLEALRAGAGSIRKPLVFYDEDRIGEETLEAKGARFVIVEGTYTSLLKNVDVRVFIERTFRETRDARIERAREEQDEFLERVLRIEHETIAEHKAFADFIVTSDYLVEEAGEPRGHRRGSPIGSEARECEGDARARSRRSASDLDINRQTVRGGDMCSADHGHRKGTDPRNRVKEAEHA
jgi:uridine kinase